MYSEGISFLTFVNETLSLLYVNLAPGLENKIGYKVMDMYFFFMLLLDSSWNAPD